jgi:hypothetical protein
MASRFQTRRGLHYQNAICMLLATSTTGLVSIWPALYNRKENVIKENISPRIMACEDC